jgi:hypothetical protein
MIAGRLLWRKKACKLPGKVGLAVFDFPDKVTAFRDNLAVHGRYKKPCPECGTAVQRIRYASNETNYCPLCQTGGNLLADRAMSRLLKRDWPRTLEELEIRKQKFTRNLADEVMKKE